MAETHTLLQRMVLTGRTCSRHTRLACQLVAYTNCSTGWGADRTALISGAEGRRTASKIYPIYQRVMTIVRTRINRGYRVPLRA
jgi:hypothetical protein